MPKAFLCWLALFTLVCSHSLFAAREGQGAVVIQDKTSVYASSTATEAVATLRRGESVSAASDELYKFSEGRGRIRINWFPADDDLGKFESGWVDPQYLSKFTYRCCCGADEHDCSPYYFLFAIDGLGWNVCFQGARDEKLESLREKGAWGPGEPAHTPQDARIAAQPPRLEWVLGEGTEFESIDGRAPWKKRLFGVRIAPGAHTVVLGQTSASVTRAGKQIEGFRFAFTTRTITFTALPGHIYILSADERAAFVSELRKVGRVKTRPGRVWNPLPEWCSEPR